MVKGLSFIHQQDKVARKASDISSWLAILITREKVSNFFASVVKAFLHNTAVYMINIFFHVCLISLISCWHVNHLSHHSVRFERQSLHDSQFKVVCQDFLRWWRLEHWKIRIAHRQWRSNSCVYMINKIIHGCFKTWNSSPRVHLDIPLVHCAHSWAIELITRREIPYLRAPMYYSLHLFCSLKTYYIYIYIFCFSS